MTWTDERVELLKKLWADGLTAGQIASQLKGVTKNAIIGKVHRLNLAARAKQPPPKPKREKEHRPRATPDGRRWAGQAPLRDGRIKVAKTPQTATTRAPAPPISPPKHPGRIESVANGPAFKNDSLSPGERAALATLYHD